MPPRLVDRFPVGARVEITFDQQRWIPGVVVAHAHPGVWVETASRQRWFVTSGRKIRLADHAGAE